MKGRKEFNYSLVEIILAIGVMAVGIVAIMSLFPVGLNSNKESIGKNNAAYAADQFLHYYADSIKKNWQITDAIPINKPSDDESEAIWNVPIEDGLGIYFNDENNNNTFDYNGSTGRDDSGLFLIEQKTGMTKDFAGAVRVWKQAATFTSYNAETGAWNDKQAVDANVGVTIKMELSWPIEKPYVAREKALYSLDVYKPGMYQKDGVVGEGDGIITLAKPGKLNFAFRGSSAALLSGFFMSAPEEIEIFSHNDESTQIDSVSKEWNVGDSFNFFIRIYGSGVVNGGRPDLSVYPNSNYGLGLYDHYAWGDTIDNGYSWSGYGSAPDHHYSGALSKDKLESDGSNRRYCICEEVIPDTKWILRFEDLPHHYRGSWSGYSDWDYYDVVVDVELEETDGGTTSAEKSVDGIVTLHDNDDMQFTLVPVLGKQKSKDDLKDSGITFDDSAVAVWFMTKGSSSQTILVGGSSINIEPDNLYYISGKNMDVKVYKDGSNWKLDMYASKANLSTTVN